MNSFQLMILKNYKRNTNKLQLHDKKKYMEPQKSLTLKLQQHLVV